MKNRIFLTMLLCMFAAAGASYAQKKATVHGELVEVVSYVKEGMKPTSAAGKEIAMENMRKGGTIALLEKGSKKMYILAPAPNDTNFVRNVTAYFGTPAAVKGAVYKRGGLNLIVVEDIGKSIKK